jgi:hypothetical protein
MKPRDPEASVCVALVDAQFHAAMAWQAAHCRIGAASVDLNTRNGWDLLAQAISSFDIAPP